MRYFNTGPLPFFFGMATSEKEFDRGCKRLGVGKIDFSEKDACTHSFQNTKTGGLTCIVCIDGKGVKKHSRSQVAALLAHEATHVWQLVCEHMVEPSPGKEIEAYSIQWMTQLMIERLEEVSG